MSLFTLRVQCYVRACAQMWARSVIWIVRRAQYIYVLTLRRCWPANKILAAKRYLEAELFTVVPLTLEELLPSSRYSIQTQHPSTYR